MVINSNSFLIPNGPGLPRNMNCRDDSLKSIEFEPRISNNEKVLMLRDALGWDIVFPQMLWTLTAEVIAVIA